MTGMPVTIREAAKNLAELCVKFCNSVSCYETVDCVVSMPPSRPDKPFDLPHFLAGEIASALGKADLRGSLKTRSKRKQLKGVSVNDKLNQLRGTVHVDETVFRGKDVLIVDDLYQSGTSVNYVGMLLLQAGARRVFALACEKTVGNVDNVGARGNK